MFKTHLHVIPHPHQRGVMDVHNNAINKGCSSYCLSWKLPEQPGDSKPWLHTMLSSATKLQMSID